MHRKLIPRGGGILTFLQNFPEKQKRKNESMASVVAGTLCSIRGPDSSPASELIICENLSKTLSISEFLFYHLENGNINICSPLSQSYGKESVRCGDVKISEI